VSWNRIPGHCRPFARLGPGLVGQVAGFGLSPVVGPYDVDSVGEVRGMGLAPIRWGLHRPYRLAHRTPALYSRNQSRTNIAL